MIHSFFSYDSSPKRQIHIPNDKKLGLVQTKIYVVLKEKKVYSLILSKESCLSMT